MDAFLLAPQLKPDLTILASLSPYFVEDKGKAAFEKIKQKFGDVADTLYRYSRQEIAPTIKTPVLSMYGELEAKNDPPLLVDAVKDAHDLLPNSTLVQVPNGPHGLAEDIYTDAVLDWLRDHPDFCA